MPLLVMMFLSVGALVGSNAGKSVGAFLVMMILSVGALVGPNIKGSVVWEIRWCSSQLGNLLVLLLFRNDQ